MIRIFLIGYMGAGKTTLGKALSRELGLPFIDLDWYTEERYHKTIRELFSEKGERNYRELEQRMLHEVAEFENVIISVGGGTPCFFDNMDFMNNHGNTVFLKVNPEVLFRRLRVAKYQRPLLCDRPDEELMDYIVTSLNERKDFYQKARFVFEANKLDNSFQIKSAVNCLKELLKIG